MRRLVLILLIVLNLLVGCSLNKQKSTLVRNEPSIINAQPAFFELEERYVQFQLNTDDASKSYTQYSLNTNSHFTQDMIGLTNVDFSLNNDLEGLKFQLEGTQTTLKSVLVDDFTTLDAHEIAQSKLQNGAIYTGMLENEHVYHFELKNSIQGLLKLHKMKWNEKKNQLQLIVHIKYLNPIQA